MDPASPTFDGEPGLVAVLDASSSAVLVVNGDGVIGYVNDVAETAFGYAREELLGQRIELLVPPAVAERHQGHRKAFAEDSRARPMGLDLDLHGRRKDGSQFPVEISLTPVQGEGGPWVIAGVANVTARQEAAARVRALSRAYLTLARLNEAVVRAHDETELFASTCRVAVEQGGYLGAWVALPADGGLVAAAATAGATDDFIARLGVTMDDTVARGRGPTALALREGVAIYSTDFQSDPRTAPWHELATEFGIRATVSLPLRRGDDVVAALTLYADSPHAFDSEMRSLLDGLADNVSFALDHFAHRGRLQRIVVERSQLLQRLVRAQEEERNRIAADVHDDSVQALAAVDLRLGLLQRRMSESAPDLVPAVEQLQSMVESVTSGLRLLLFELEPNDADATLEELLHEAAATVFDGTTVQWAVAVERSGEPLAGDPTWLPSLTQGQALRVAKEALINARKHAQAGHVRVDVRPRADGVEIAVVDDGVGIGTDHATSPAGHRGLTTMRERAEVSGGWFRVERGEVGTTMRFWMPRSSPVDGSSSPAEPGGERPLVRRR